MGSPVCCITAGSISHSPAMDQRLRWVQLGTLQPVSLPLASPSPVSDFSRTKFWEGQSSFLFWHVHSGSEVSHAQNPLGTAKKQWGKRRGKNTAGGSSEPRASPFFPTCGGHHPQAFQLDTKETSFLLVVRARGAPMVELRGPTGRQQGAADRIRRY